MKFFFSILLSALFLASCANPGEEFTSGGIDSYVQVEPGFQVLNNNEITGNGSIRLLNSLPSYSGRSISIKGSLNLANNSHISVIMYSPSTSVGDSSGLVVRFSRGGALVSAVVSINGNQAQVAQSKLSFYVPANLDLTVEMHNTGSKARLFVWRNDMMVYNPSTADIDTNRSGDLNGTLPTQTASGGNVGLRLTQATVTRFNVALPKVLPQQ